MSRLNSTVSTRWPRRAGLLLAGAAMVVLAGCARSTPVVAAKRDVVAYLKLDGTVIAPPTAVDTIYPPYQTTVKKVDATVNEQIRKGATLVELTIPAADQAVQAARENLRQAEAAYSQAKANAAATVRAARQEAATASSTSQTSPDVNGAPASGTANTAGAGGTTTASVGSAGGANTTSAAPTAADRQAARAAVAQTRAEEAASLEPLREQVAAARAALRDALAGRAQGLIRSGITGTVTVLNAQAGQTVGQNRNAPLAVVVNLQKLQVQAPLAPEQVAYAKVETPVKLTFAGVPNKVFDGRIAQVTTVADKSGKVTSYIAAVEFDNGERLVMPNQKAEASIKLGAAHDVVAVPNGAISRDNAGQTVVEVNRNGRWVTTPVVVGLSDGAYTEIKQGVQAGEEVKVNKPVL